MTQQEYNDLVNTEYPCGSNHIDWHEIRTANQFIGEAMQSLPKWKPKWYQRAYWDRGFTVWLFPFTAWVRRLPRRDS